MSAVLRFFVSGEISLDRGITGEDSPMSQVFVERINSHYLAFSACLSMVRPISDCSRLEREE